MDEMNPLDPSSFPNNSDKEKYNISNPEKSLVGKSEKTKQNPPAKVHIRKKNSAENALASFLGESIRNVLYYVRDEVLIPACKETLNNMVSNGFEMLLFGSDGRRAPKTHNGYVNYSSTRPYSTYKNYSVPPWENDPRHPIDPGYGSPRKRRGADEIIFRFDEYASALEAKEAADMTLTHLVNCLDEYQQVRASDLYEWLGQTVEWVDQKWGWYDLRMASVRRTRIGYLLDLPPMVELQI